MLSFVMSHERSFYRILSVLYLINDILHSAHHQVFTPQLSAGGLVPRMFEAAAAAAGSRQRDRERLVEVLDVWEARSLLHQNVLGDLRRICDRMMGDYKRPNEGGYYGNGDYLQPSYPKRERFN